MNNDELTFAEALRLCGKRGEVEYMRHGHGWQEFYINQQHGPHANVNLEVMANFAESKFRRAKPKRSRVQEMGDGLAHYTCAVPAMAEAIRAVCEYLSEERYDSLSADVEREFLVPR